MDPVSLSEIVGHELFILTTSKTPIRLQVVRLNDEELSTYTSLDVIVLEIPEGLGYMTGAGAPTRLFIAQREGKTVADMLTTVSILPYTTSEIALGYFGLLSQGELGRAFQIEEMEIR